MEIEEFLSTIAAIVNRSIGQTLFLFDLCGHDMNKYLKLEATLKSNTCCFVPADVETVDAFMQQPLKPVDSEFKDYYFVLKEQKNV